MRNWMIRTVVASFLAASSAAAQVPAEPVLRLSFDEAGRVDLVAQNVTVRDILAEWARQCGCLIVNADRLSGPPLATPVQFERATQSEVLESLLRQAAGYVLTPRRADAQGASNYETIYILAVSNPVAGAYVPPPPVNSGPPPPTAGSPDDEIPPVRPEPGAEPPPPVPERPAPSNPFGSRTGAFEPDRPVNQPSPAPAPGAPSQTPAPGRTAPVVPIVAVPRGQ